MARVRSWKRGALALVAVATGLASLSSVHAQRALREHLTPKLSAVDCRHVLRLTPEEAAALGWFEHHRMLSECKEVKDLLGVTQTPLEVKKTEVKNTITDQSKAKIAERGKWVPTTPDQVKAHAAAEVRAKELAAAQAELDVKQAALKKQLDASAEKQKADQAKSQEYNNQLKKEADARAVEEQKVEEIKRQVELDRVQKQNDQAQADIDAKLRKDFAAAQKADLERQKLDQDAKAQEEKRLSDDKLQRDADKKQEEADRLQAEADKHSTDAQLKAKNQAQRDQNVKTRTENELARQKRESEFNANEEARLKREREAEAASVKRQRAEDEMRKEEAARAQRQKDFDENEKARVAREKEFADAQAERDARLKKMKEDEDARELDAQKRRDADAKAKGDVDAKKTDVNNKDDDIPDEEKPKKDHEEECKTTTPGGGDKVTCHNGGVCYQSKTDADSKRCKCEKGYKGEKCEYEACSATDKDGNIKTGNKVDGKCVRWDGEYSCPGCNRKWSLTTRCVAIKPGGIEKITSASDCTKMKKPTNEFEDETCKKCFTNCKVKGRDGRRQLQKTTLPPTTSRPDGGYNYAYAPSCGYGYLEKAFVYSLTPHTHDTITPAARIVSKTTMEECLELCWEARGQLDDRSDYYNGMYPLTKNHCTFVFWTEDNICRMYHSGDLPELAVQPRFTGKRNRATSDKTKQVTSGFMAFVSFARRFDIHRNAECADLKLFEAREGSHGVCPGSGGVEGSGTSYVGRSSIINNVNRKPCAATYETVLDASLHYDKLSGPNVAGATAELDNRLVTPDSLKHLHEEGGFEPFDMTSTSSRQEWEYRIDRLGRVVSVKTKDDDPLPTDNRVRGDRPTISPKAYQVLYNYEMHLGRAMNVRAYQAGHLVGAQQKPPNFFFNYVPQHGKSNSAGGCWWYTEQAAADFQQLGCRITYDIKLTYREDTAANPWITVPHWVDQTAYDRPITVVPKYFDRYFDTNCHYRFRPIKMALDFQLKIGDDGTTCANLFASEPVDWEGAMFKVTQASPNTYTLTSSRVKAYLTQKWIGNFEPDRAPSPTRKPQLFKKLYAIATTSLHRAGGDLACYAESGEYYPFDRIEFKPDFKKAFLSETTNNRCLSTDEHGRLALRFDGSANNCPTWTYVDGHTADTEFSGEVIKSGIHGNDPDSGSCIFLDLTIGEPSNQPGRGKADCAKFVYLRDPATYDWTTNPTISLGGAQPAAEVEMDLDSLVEGVVMNQAGSECLVANGDSLNFQPFAIIPSKKKIAEVNCFIFRVSYYPIAGRDVPGVNVPSITPAP